MTTTKDAGAEIRVVIYVRFSDEMQSPRSADDQERECRRLAEQMGWTVVAVERDIAVRAGAIAGRHGLRRALESAKGGAFDILVVEELSRFSRDFFVGITLLSEMKDAGVGLADTKKGLVDLETMMGQLLVALDFAKGQDETKQLGERSKRGQKGKVLRKFSGGGHPPYGYKRVPVFSETERDVDGRPQRLGVRFEVHPDEAPIVRRIFREYDDGNSKHAIAKGLNRDGVPTKHAGRSRMGRPNSGTWSPAVIKAMLAREIYIGRRIWNQTSRTGKKLRSGKKRQHLNPETEWVKVEDFAPAIIDDDLFERVQKRLAEDYAKYKRNRNAKNHTQHLLSGLIVCAECGANFVITRHRRGVRQYCCSFHTSRGKSVCGNKVEVPLPGLEARLKDVLDSVAKDPQSLKALVAEHNARIGDLNEQQLGVVRALEARHEALAIERDRLVAAIASGAMAPGAIVEAISDRERELEALSARIEEAQAMVQPYLLPQPAAVEDYISGGTSLFDGDRARERTFLEGVLSGIYVYPDGSVVVRFRESSLFAPVVAHHLELTVPSDTSLATRRQLLSADHAKTIRAQEAHPALTEVVTIDNADGLPIVVARRPGSAIGEVHQEVIHTELPPPDPDREADLDRKARAEHPELTERVVEELPGGRQVVVHRRPRAARSAKDCEGAEDDGENRVAVPLGTLHILSSRASGTARGACV